MLNLVSLFDNASDQGTAVPRYGWEVFWVLEGNLSSSIQLCHSCVTPDITKGTRQYCNAVLPVIAPKLDPKFADASAGTGTQGTRQKAASDMHKTLFCAYHCFTQDHWDQNHECRSVTTVYYVL